MIFIVRMPTLTLEANFYNDSEMMNSLTRTLFRIASHWRSAAAVAGFVGIALTCRRCLETGEARAERAERKRQEEIRAVADRISRYARKVHNRYPTGDVVVGEKDLAEQLRKRPDIIGTALTLLLGEQKVQKAPLSGYWKLNV